MIFAARVFQFGFIGVVLLPTIVLAQTIGHTYPVIEENLLDVITQKAASIDIRKHLQRAVKHQLGNRLSNVLDNSHLPEQKNKTTRRFVPTITVPATQTTPQKTEPLLKYVVTFQPVIFLHADWSHQVVWLHHRLKQYPHATVIVTGGDIGSLMSVTHHLVSIDEHGGWVKKFQLRALPALITHDGGLALTVEEGLGSA